MNTQQQRNHEDNLLSTIITYAMNQRYSEAEVIAECFEISSLKNNALRTIDEIKEANRYPELGPEYRLGMENKPYIALK